MKNSKKNIHAKFWPVCFSFALISKDLKPNQAVEPFGERLIVDSKLIIFWIQT